MASRQQANGAGRRDRTRSASPNAADDARIGANALVDGELAQRRRNNGFDLDLDGPDVAALGRGRRARAPPPARYRDDAPAAPPAAAPARRRPAAANADVNMQDAPAPLAAPARATRRRAPTDVVMADAPADPAAAPARATRQRPPRSRTNTRVRSRNAAAPPTAAADPATQVAGQLTPAATPAPPAAAPPAAQGRAARAARREAGQPAESFTAARPAPPPIPTTPSPPPIGLYRFPYTPPRPAPAFGLDPTDPFMFPLPAALTEDGDVAPCNDPLTLPLGLPHHCDQIRRCEDPKHIGNEVRTCTACYNACINTFTPAELQIYDQGAYLPLCEECSVDQVAISDACQCGWKAYCCGCVVDLVQALGKAKVERMADSVEGECHVCIAKFTGKERVLRCALCAGVRQKQ